VTARLTLLLPILCLSCTGSIGGGGVGDDDGDDDVAPGAPDASVPGHDVDADPGAPDAAPSAVTCADPTLLFCDDFESYALGAATSDRWTPETSAGSLTIDATQARGTRALHVHTDGNGRAYIRVAPFAPPGNSFFGRMYVWVTAFPSAPDYAHFTMVEAAGAGGGVIRPIGGQYIPAPTAGTSLWGAGSDGGATGDWTNWQVSTPAAAGRWVCMEWEMRASENRIEVSIDGVAKPELSVSTQQHGGNAVDFVFPTFTNVWFGWWLYQGGPTPAQFDLWLDDIALATTKIGC
jgi:hypothetical protein